MYFKDVTFLTVKKTNVQTNYCGKHTKSKIFRINWNFVLNRWVLIPQTELYFQNWYSYRWFGYYSFFFEN